MTKVPKIIWSYWHDEKLPELNTLCLLSWKTNLPNYKIKILNANNIYKYIDVSEKNKSKLSKLNLAKQSDYFRFCLLYKYGGFWVDSSTFINSNLDFVHESFEKDSELDVFFSIKNLRFKYKDYFHWETFFLVSKKKTNFMKLLINKFEEVYFYNGTYMEPSSLDCLKLGCVKDYHAVFWFYEELAITNDYFKNQCNKQSFFSNNIFNYIPQKSHEIINNHINYYKNNIYSDDIKKYKLYKMTHGCRNYKRDLKNYFKGLQWFIRCDIKT